MLRNRLVGEGVWDGVMERESVEGRCEGGVAAELSDDEGDAVIVTAALPLPLNQSLTRNKLVKLVVGCDAP